MQRERNGRSAHPGEADNLTVVQNGHDARNNALPNPKLSRPRHKIEIVPRVEKQLGGHKIGPAVHLCPEMLQVLKRIHAFRVRLGIARHPNTKVTAAVGQGHQLGGMSKTVRDRGKYRFAAGRITTQTHEILDTTVFQLKQNISEFRLAVPHAGQMGHTDEPQFGLEATHQIDGILSCRTPGTVGHRAKAGPQLLEFAGSIKKRLSIFCCLWGEKFKRKRLRVSIKECSDFHVLQAIFSPFEIKLLVSCSLCYQAVRNESKLVCVRRSAASPLQADLSQYTIHRAYGK